MTFFVLTTHPTRGTVVVAASNLFPKTCVAIETPLVVFPFESTDRRPTPVIPYCDAPAWNLYQQYLRLAPEVQSKLLEFYVDMHCLKAEGRRLIFSAVPPGLFDSELVIRIAMLVEFNAFGIKNIGHAFYSIVGKLSHSCRPNCFWEFEGENIRIQVIDHIEKGQELTIDYESSRSQTMPIVFRRPYLLRSKGFTCMCPRCAAPFDDTRRFYCVKAPKCPGIHYKSNRYPILFSLTCCNTCGYEPTEKQTVFIQDEEQLLLNQTTACKEKMEAYQFDFKISELVAQWKPPHPHHFLAHHYWEFKLVGAQQDGNDDGKATLDMIKYSRSKVQCLRAIIPCANAEIASDLEKLGDCLNAHTMMMYTCPKGFEEIQIYGKKEQVTLENLKEAQDVYREALFMCGVLRGDSSATAETVSYKLVEIQKKLTWNEDVVLPLQVCCLCGHVCNSERGEAPLKNCGVPQSIVLLCGASTCTVANPQEVLYCVVVGIKKKGEKVRNSLRL